MYDLICVPIIVPLITYGAEHIIALKTRTFKFKPLALVIAYYQYHFVFHRYLGVPKKWGSVSSPQCVNPQMLNQLVHMFV